jgi:hypothetical protein
VALFTAGQPLTAAQLNAINGFVSKTADQSVTSSTTLTNDTHLSFAIPAAGTYLADLYLYVTSAANAAGSIKLGFSFPAGTLHFASDGGTGMATGTSGSGEWAAALSATSGTTVLNYSVNTGAMYINTHAILTATASGTLRLMWAQIASNVNATTVKAGSHMRVTQVA